jgi:Flp pilus assembly protein TadG
VKILDQRRRATRGQAIGIVVIALPLFFIFVGFAIDFSRMFAAQARLQAAVDAAALAGSLKLAGDQSVSNGGVRNAATDYLSRNYPEATLVNVAPGANERSGCVTARVSLATSFMRLSGINSGTVAATACAGFQDLEVAIVIDNSSSMNGTPIANVRTSATDLVDLLIPDAKTPRVKFALVPFRGKVRLPGGVDGLAAGCRNANGTLNNSNVTPPDNSCKDAALPPVQALTEDKKKIKDAIAKLQAGDDAGDSSGTIVPEGIRYGREVLTPAAPFTEGKPRGQTRKVIVLLTDGDNEDGTCTGSSCNPRTDATCHYRRNAYFQQSPAVTTCGCGDGACLDTATLTQATGAKGTDGIEIFVIRYGGSDAYDTGLLKQVASPGKGNLVYYFDAPTAAAIPDMFDKIGRQLAYRLI